jgi:hypothetical protein
LKNKKTPGQAVVIITILIAVIILLGIILINIGKVADIKTTTAQIADSGVLTLASQWSMYCNTLKDTMVRKYMSSTLLGGLECHWDIQDVKVSCLNWWFILSLFGVLLAIILIPYLPGISAAIIFLVVNPLYNQVNAIMKSGFETAAAEMTQYQAMRESSIESMLQQAQFDKAYAYRNNTDPSKDIFEYTYKRWDPALKRSVDYHYTYDVTGLPFAATVKKADKLPRFAAWYWSKRHPRVSEYKLVPLVENFIRNSLLPITELNTWDVPTWMYTEVSLIVHAAVTCGDAANPCPEWADPDKQIVRIVSHVSAQEQNVILSFVTWLQNILGICPTSQLGFLPVKFIDLSDKLRGTVQYKGYVTWSDCEIVTVTEALRGLMLRITELINLPVSHRIPTLNDWLPVWYNYNTPSDPDTIYQRLQDIIDGKGSMVGITEWLEELKDINDDIRAILPVDDESVNGDCANGYGHEVGWCWLISCCDPCEYECCCSCSCCGATNWCTWVGIYCSCNPEIGGAGLCGHGDLYSTRYPPCPLTPLNISPCECPGCYDCCRAPTLHSIEACRFQGEDNWRNQGGVTEIDQAIEVLTNLRTDLKHLIIAIKTFGDAAHAIMYPTGLTAQLQKEAIYGWKDDAIDSANIVRVNLENYPSRDVFPYIKEGFAFFGIWKTWEIVGQTHGVIGEATVQRYTSDISVGSWWQLKYRKNPRDPEWNTTTLGAIPDVGVASGGYIHNVQDTGVSGAPASEFSTYAINSTTRGYYGMHKEDIRIERMN